MWKWIKNLNPFAAELKNTKGLLEFARVALNEALAQLAQAEIELADKAFYVREFAAVSQERDALKVELARAREYHSDFKRLADEIADGTSPRVKQGEGEPYTIPSVAEYEVLMDGYLQQRKELAALREAIRTQHAELFYVTAAKELRVGFDAKKEAKS